MVPFTDIQQKFSERPQTLPTEGVGEIPPLVLPPLVPSALDGFLCRTTFKQSATALIIQTKELQFCLVISFSDLYKIRHR